MKVTLRIEGTPAELEELRAACVQALPGLADDASPAEALVRMYLDDLLQRHASVAALEAAEAARREREAARARVESARVPVRPELP